MNSGFQKIPESKNVKSDGRPDNQRKTQVFNKLEYWMAVEHGFDGTPDEWMEALREICS